MTLTVKEVQRLTEPGRYGDGHGLYLVVVSPSNRSWQLRYEHHGRERWMGLGPTHTFSLDEARQRARLAKQQLHSGIDPIDARKAQRAQRALEDAKRITFQSASEQYFAAHERKWNNA